MNTDEIKSYYEENSDLAFELEICNILRSCSCYYEHSGRYADSLTQRFREYDILANPPMFTIDGGHNKYRFDLIEMAIECKNISRDCPLIVGTRKESSEFVEYIEICDNQEYAETVFMRQINVALMPEFIHQFGQYFIEDIGIEPVQVARDKSGALKSGDRTSTYDKWSQAISHSIIRYQNCVRNLLEDEIMTGYSYWCVPILVVPDGTLFSYAGHESEKVRSINGLIMKVNCPFEVSTVTHETAKISNYFLFTTTGLRHFLTMFKSSTST